MTVQDWLASAIVLVTAAWLVSRVLLHRRPTSNCTRCSACAEPASRPTVEVRIGGRPAGDSSH